MAANERHCFRNGCLAALSAILLLGIPNAAAAQANDRCPRLVSALPSPIQKVSLRLAQKKAETAVNITFVGHSTFLIESAAGIRIATDYNDYVRPAVIPEVATMNRAHSTHYTDYPDPGIKFVLRGWGEPGKPARHEVEIAGLCIAHLGHLHHTLTPAHLDALGRIDVVMVPVDGSFTLNTDGMVEVLKQIDAPAAIPMHIFGEGTLTRFLDKMGQIYEVQRHPSATIVMSREMLPKTRTMIVLPGR
ncbi:MAG: MBL fold metallo-hydrolase [Xanthobacteraceae bacterium]|nr:MBL fold metallo-hydrolase [Xanthobacteraceae bacterium]